MDLKSKNLIKLKSIDLLTNINIKTIVLIVYI